MFDDSATVNDSGGGRRTSIVKTLKRKYIGIISIIKIAVISKSKFYSREKKH